MHTRAHRRAEEGAERRILCAVVERMDGWMEVCVCEGGGGGQVLGGLTRTRTQTETRQARAHTEVDIYP